MFALQQAAFFGSTMIDVLQRASAMKRLIATADAADLRSTVAQAMLTCCSELLNAGEVDAAIELLSYADNPRSPKIPFGAFACKQSKCGR